DESWQRSNVVHALERQLHLAADGVNRIVGERDQVRRCGPLSRGTQRARGLLPPERVGILQVVNQAFHGNLASLRLRGDAPAGRSEGKSSEREYNERQPLSAGLKGHKSSVGPLTFRVFGRHALGPHGGGTAAGPVDPAGGTAVYHTSGDRVGHRPSKPAAGSNPRERPSHDLGFLARHYSP